MCTALVSCGALSLSFCCVCTAVSWEEESLRRSGPISDADGAQVRNAARVHTQGLQASAACYLDLARCVHSRETRAYGVYGQA